MKIKILDIHPHNNILKLKISGISSSLANSLRRIMIAEVESWAIDTVDFYRNESIMSMEEIGHRLGLLPLKVKGSKNDKQPSVSLTITAADNLTVTAKDMVYENCKPVYPDMPILILKKGHTVKFTAVLTKNSKISGGHAKWSPTTVVFYEKKGDEYYFTIESSGVMKPEKIFSEALDIFEKKIDSPYETET